MPEAFGLLCLLIGAAMVVVAVDAWRKGRRRRTPAGNALERDYCPRCASPLAGDQCLLCLWPAAAAGHAAELGLRSLTQHMDALRRAGMLPCETGERLLASIELELKQAAAAVPPPVVEVSPIEIEIVPEPAPPPVQAARAPVMTSVAERAHQYSLQRGQAAEAPLAPPPPPPEPRARLTDLLATFMEEKNVRWGELVGGLLIVGGSIALVISFWKQIAEQPWLKFGLFNGVVAALFALGFYTRAKWKLPTTSRGVLAIATLLVPLNFLAIAAFTKDASLVNNPVVIVGELISLAVFAALVYFAGRSITTAAPLALTVGTIGPCVAALLIRRFVAGDVATDRLYGFFSLPLLCHAAAVGAALWRLRRTTPLEEWHVNGLLRLLGLTAFAVFPACGLLLFLTGDAAATLHRVAPLFALAGGPSLAAGLMLWRRLSESELTGLRTAGTAIAILGSLVMLAGVALAWPEPALLVAVAGMNFIVLTAVALAYEMPASHLLAGAALALAYLVALHVVRGELAWSEVEAATTTRALVSAESGNGLALLAALYGIAACARSYFCRRRDAVHYALVAAGAAAVSLVLVTFYGFGRPGDPHGATWVYGLYATMALAFAAWIAPAAEKLPDRLRRLPETMAWAGSMLAAAALAQGFVYRYADAWSLAAPWTTAALAHGLLMLGLALLHRAASGRRDAAQESLVTTALVAAVAAAALIAIDLPRTTVPWSACATHAALLSLLWFLAALWRSSAELFALFQVALFAALGLAGVDLASHESWFARSPAPWVDPRMLLLQGQLAAVLCLTWLAVRVAISRTTGLAARWQPLVEPRWPAVDRVVSAGVLALLMVVASYAALPGVAQELAPRKTVAELQKANPELVTVTGSRVVPKTAALEPAGLPHSEAGGGGAWLLMGLTLALLVGGLWERVNPWRVLGILAALAAACPLLAAPWEAEVATASALRWLASIFFLVGSVGFWSREWLAQTGRRIGWRFDEQSSQPGFATPLAALAALAVAPLLAMGGYVALAAVRHASIGQEMPLVYGLALVAAVALAVAAALALVSRRAGAAVVAGRTNWNVWAGSAGTLVMVLGAAPLLVMSIFIVAKALAGNPVVGPEPTSLFTRMSLAVNYSVPAALVAVVLVGFAIRERSSGFAFVAALVTMLSATCALLFTVGGKLSAQQPDLWIDLGQLNALVAALFGLAWWGALWWAGRKANEEPAVSPLHVVLAAIAGSLNLLALVSASLSLVLTPLSPPTWLMGAADPLGVAAATSALALGLLLAGRGAPLVSIALSAAGLWAGATLVGLAATRWDNLNFVALHTLLTARSLAPALLLGGLAIWTRRDALPLLDSRRRAATLWASLLAIPAVLIAWRLLPANDPQEPWWLTAAMLGSAGTAIALAFWSCRRRFPYVAASLVILAAVCWYPRSSLWPLTGSADLKIFAWLHWALSALTLPVAGWLALELRWIRPRRDAQGPAQLALAVHRPATWVAVLFLGLLTTLGVLADFAKGAGSPPFDPPWTSTAVTLTLIAAVACLWDVRAREAAAVLYLYGLVLVGVYIDRLNLHGVQLVWAGAMATAAFTLASSYFWSRQESLRAFAARTLRMPARSDSPTAGLAWMAPLTAAIVAAVVVLAYWVEVRGAAWSMRIAAGQAILAQAVALGLLARDRLRLWMQQGALAAGVLGLVACGWSWVAPGHEQPILARSVATCVALIVAAVVYGLGFTKLPERWSDWIGAAARFTPAVVVALVASVVAVLGQESFFYLQDGSVPLGVPGITAVAVALVLLFAAVLAAALLPGRDPLGLSERGRMTYVYAAEAVLAMLFLHIRVSAPSLFTGRFQMYWPLIVMFIAFLGVGLGEWFGRRQQKVLAEPLEQTGVLLPLLPVLGFWFIDSQTNYAALLLVVGLLYATLAVTRKSFGFGLLAALAANGGLWHYLSRIDGLGLLEHPQLWLIPPALCVLAASLLNRDRLNAGQMTAIRYITSMTIYLSRTADVFLKGVAQEPWLVLVLGGLAIAGIMAGIVLRVRAFLYLGSSFLVLAIVTLIWHAAFNLDQMWVLYACFIAMGVAIIVLFAVFEKKRQEIMGLVDQLKHWQA